MANSLKSNSQRTFIDLYHQKTSKMHQMDPSNALQDAYNVYIMDMWIQNKIESNVFIFWFQHFFSLKKVKKLESNFKIMIRIFRAYFFRNR